MRRVLSAAAVAGLVAGALVAAAAPPKAAGRVTPSRSACWPHSPVRLPKPPRSWRTRPNSRPKPSTRRAVSTVAGLCWKPTTRRPIRPPRPSRRSAPSPRTGLSRWSVLHDFGGAGRRRRPAPGWDRGGGRTERVLPGGSPCCLLRCL